MKEGVSFFRISFTLRRHEGGQLVFGQMTDSVLKFRLCRRLAQQLPRRHIIEVATVFFSDDSKRVCTKGILQDFRWELLTVILAQAYRRVFREKNRPLHTEWHFKDRPRHLKRLGFSHFADK